MHACIHKVYRRQGAKAPKKLSLRVKFQSGLYCHTGLRVVHLVAVCVIERQWCTIMYKCNGLWLEALVQHKYKLRHAFIS